MEHTPGPWKIEYETDHDFLIVAPWSNAVKPGNTELFGDYRGGHVCNITFIDNASVPTERQALANAELIAQAPELKKRLESAESRAAQAEKERAGLRRQLADIKRILAVGRNVGEDKEQAYEDAEEIADFALHGKQALQQFERTAPIDWRESYQNALDWISGDEVTP